MDDIDLDEPTGATVLASDIDKVIEAVMAADPNSGWQRNVELDLGARRWRPPATAADSSRVLCVALHGELPRSTVERIQLARANGIKVTAAVTIAALYREELLAILVDADSDVLVVDDYLETRRYERRHCLAALADIEVPVAPSARRDIARKAWACLGDGTSQEKGRRLEALLAFLFSQVNDLKVVERNYRTETEEIDLVLQVDNFSPRVWQKPGVPFILVEAKNRLDKATQPMMSILLNKLQTKRGSARIGLMISIGGFTSDAREHELRFSTQDICVVMIDSTGLESLLASNDLDDDLEKLVRRGLLR